MSIQAQWEAMAGHVGLGLLIKVLRSLSCRSTCSHSGVILVIPNKPRVLQWMVVYKHLSNFLVRYFDARSLVGHETLGTLLYRITLRYS